MATIEHIRQLARQRSDAFLRKDRQEVERLTRELERERREFDAQREREERRRTGRDRATLADLRFPEIPEDIRRQIAEVTPEGISATPPVPTSVKRAQQARQAAEEAPTPMARRRLTEAAELVEARAAGLAPDPVAQAQQQRRAQTLAEGRASLANAQIQAQNTALQRLQEFPDLVTASEALGEAEFRQVAIQAGYKPKDIESIAQAAQETTPEQRALYARLKPYEFMPRDVPAAARGQTSPLLDIGRAANEGAVTREDLRVLEFSEAEIDAIFAARTPTPEVLREQGRFVAVRPGKFGTSAELFELSGRQYLLERTEGGLVVTRQSTPGEVAAEAGRALDYLLPVVGTIQLAQSGAPRPLIALSALGDLLLVGPALKGAISIAAKAAARPAAMQIGRAGIVGRLPRGEPIRNIARETQQTIREAERQATALAKSVSPTTLRKPTAQLIQAQQEYRQALIDVERARKELATARGAALGRAEFELTPGAFTGNPETGIRLSAIDRATKAEQSFREAFEQYGAAFKRTFRGEGAPGQDAQLRTLLREALEQTQEQARVIATGQPRRISAIQREITQTQRALEDAQARFKANPTDTLARRLGDITARAQRLQGELLAAQHGNLARIEDDLLRLSNNIQALQDVQRAKQAGRPFGDLAESFEFRRLEDLPDALRKLEQLERERRATLLTMRPKPIRKPPSPRGVGDEPVLTKPQTLPSGSGARVRSTGTASRPMTPAIGALLRTSAIAAPSPSTPTQPVTTPSRTPATTPARPVPSRRRQKAPSFEDLTILGGIRLLAPDSGTASGTRAKTKVTPTTAPATTPAAGTEQKIQTTQDTASPPTPRTPTGGGARTPPARLRLPSGRVVETGGRFPAEMTIDAGVFTRIVNLRTGAQRDILQGPGEPPRPRTVTITKWSSRPPRVARKDSGIVDYRFTYDDPLEARLDFVPDRGNTFRDITFRSPRLRDRIFRTS